LPARANWRARASPALAWAARERSRPGAAGEAEAWTLHASAAWSRAQLEADAERAGACGDWCLGGRVEAAFDSGIALARAVLAEGWAGRTVGRPGPPAGRARAAGTCGAGENRQRVEIYRHAVCVA
jgi:predicted NAD/FAD-dependent oxidoreductase